MGHLGHKFTEEELIKMSARSKEQWADPLYKEKMIAIHKARWTDELKEKQSIRLTGKLRPEHSRIMAGRKNPKISEATKGVPKPEGFGKKISDALSGVPKSEEHKKKLRGPKQRICRLIDRKELSVNHYTRWLLSILRSQEV